MINAYGTLKNIFLQCLTGDAFLSLNHFIFILLLKRGTAKKKKKRHPISSIKSQAISLNCNIPNFLLKIILLSLPA